MSVKQLAGLIKAKESEIKEAGDSLVEVYKKGRCGVQIIKNGSRYQMVSAPENSKLVRDFLNDETTGELSRPSLETLTIIAYRGPIAKSELDRIRGVNCSLILRNLLIRGLVEAKSRKEDEGQIYTVSMDFVRFLGINDVAELPDYERLSQDNLIDKVLNDALGKNGPEPGQGRGSDEDGGAEEEVKREAGPEPVEGLGSEEFEEPESLPGEAGDYEAGDDDYENGEEGLGGNDGEDGFWEDEYEEEGEEEFEQEDEDEEEEGEELENRSL